MESTIVSAVGIAHAEGFVGAPADGAAGDFVQDAMVKVIHDTEKACDAIWAREDLTLEEKQQQIAALTDPTTMHQRMLAARDAENERG